MSSIGSGIGIASGLDISSLVKQMLAAETQRRVPLQQRLAQIAQTRAALQQTRSSLLALRNSASTLALPSILNATSISSSNPSAIVASLMTGATASIGSTSILVRSMASASRIVSAAIDNPNAALGALGGLVRFGGGQLTDDRSLSLLNGGAGVERGRIRITDRSGSKATIDLRDAQTIDDVLRAINEASSISVDARLRADGRGIEIVDLSGGSGTLLIQEFGAGATAASLGILGSAASGLLVGKTIATLSASTPLHSLSGGVAITNGAPDFVIAVDGVEVSVDLGAGAGGVPPRAQTLGEVIERTHAALASAGVGGALTISIAPGGDRLRVTSSTPSEIHFLAPPGIASGQPGVIHALGLPSSIPPGDGPTMTTIVDGDRLIVGMHDVLLSRLEGGTGLVLAGSLKLSDRAGRSITIDDFSGVDSVQSLIARIHEAISTVPGMSISVSVDSSGTRLRFADTAPGPGVLKASGTIAETLGLAALTSSGASANGVLQSRDLRRADIGWGTSLSAFASDTPSGSLRITAASGATALIAVSKDMTVADLAQAIAKSGLPVSLTINALGDAVEVIDHSGATGPLSIVNESGNAATALGLAGTSLNGRIDGTRSVAFKLTGSESAAQLAALLNGFAGVSSEIVTNDDGSAALMVTASHTGARHGVKLAIDGVDLGWSTITQARDARVLVNAQDGNGTLVTSASNMLNDIIPGVALELKGESSENILIAVEASLQPLKTSLASFAALLNAALNGLHSGTAVDPEAGTRGALYGNSLATRMRDALRALVGRTFGPDGRRLSSLGITLGANGGVNINQAALEEAVAADPDGVRAMIEGPQGLSARVESLLATLVEPGSGAIDGDDARLERVAGNASARIDRIDQAIERRRTVLLARFAAMESTIERLRWQQSTLLSIMGSLGSRS
ncbi:MAG: flagellar filament capping protein FliD [Phycisphaeraceae bacterium]|nr:flagellar filament capping protein FliD [Phycisphaeraceae bacterium]